MSLRKALYHYCEQNDLKDLSCIIHFSIVNYITTHKSQENDLYISAEVLASYIGISEDEINNMLNYLSENSTSIRKYYALYCPNYEIENDQEREYYCDGIEADIFEDKDEEVSCMYCNELHTIDEINEYETQYIAQKNMVLKELEIATQNIIKEMMVLNINEDNLNKLAKILMSRIEVEPKDKEKAKSGITKLLYNVKEVSGLISGISGDVADTANSIRKIGENAVGIETLKDIIR